jgi:hypothetical protein
VEEQWHSVLIWPVKPFYQLQLVKSHGISGDQMSVFESDYRHSGCMCLARNIHGSIGLPNGEYRLIPTWPSKSGGLSDPCMNQAPVLPQPLVPGTIPGSWSYPMEIPSPTQDGGKGSTFLFLLVGLGGSPPALSQRSSSCASPVYCDLFLHALQGN